MDIVASITASLSSHLQKMVSSQLHPIVHITILGAIQKAVEFSQIITCTNVPIHCPLCPPAVSGDPPTIWKYNALYHLISEHSSRSTPPLIPGQLLVQMFINKEEEQAIGISEQNTVEWRKKNNIPDSAGFEAVKTRKRSDTVSTAHSDSHDCKRNILEEIVE